MRAIMIGDNQFDLYRSVRDALISMERPGAASGDYFVFDESGQKYEFVVDLNDDSQVGSFTLVPCEGGGLAELMAYYSEWVAENELNDLPPPGPSLLDDLQGKWGFCV